LAKILVIGGGFAGCIASHLLSGKGHDITMIEQGKWLGGGCKTFRYGGLPYTFGPRHFLTKKEEHFAWLNQYCPLRHFDQGHEFLTFVEGDERFYHFPMHRDEVDEMPDAAAVIAELAQCKGPENAKNLEEYWQMSVGNILYEKFVKKYSQKMWQIESNTELTEFGYTAKGVSLATGGKAAWAGDVSIMSAFPYAQNGYDDYFDLATKDIKVHLDTTIEAYDIENYRVKVAGEWHKYDVIISTIFPEVLMNNAYGPLRWMGRDFFKIVLPVEKVFPDEVYFLYYANDEPFTRIVDYKKFFFNESPNSIIGLEIPSFKNKLYPFTTKKDQAQAQLYFDAMPKNVHSIGRSGTYRYLDVGNIVEQCLGMFSDF
jgi:UDP-galactopyranose mutase